MENLDGKSFYDILKSMEEPLPIILVIWKPGSGKSTLTGKISQFTWFQIIDTIWLREETIKKNETIDWFDTHPNFQGDPTQILTIQIRDKIKNLSWDKGLIIEWVWRTHARRQEIIESAKTENKPIILIEVSADYEVRRGRIESRIVRWQSLEHTNKKEVLDEYEETYQPVNGIDGISYIKVDTSNETYSIVKKSIHTNHLLIKQILELL